MRPPSVGSDSVAPEFCADAKVTKLFRGACGGLEGGGADEVGGELDGDEKKSRGPPDSTAASCRRSPSCGELRERVAPGFPRGCLRRTHAAASRRIISRGLD
mmetsp:Transcript_21160/g.53344  ORF Transcript_21160/g.53344 Transcript_21160/m.53344 type:complete len:102 (-) Transcript_21160:186-491(-)